MCVLPSWQDWRNQRPLCIIEIGWVVLSVHNNKFTRPFSKHSLTARDKAANTFEKNLSRSTPRTDTPLMLPVPGEAEEIRRHRELLHINSLENWRRGEVDQAQISYDPVSDFQDSLVMLGHLLNTKAHGKAHTIPIRTEHEAAIHIHESLARFLENKNR